MNASKARMLTNKGVIILEFFDDDAPNTVKNFLSLAEQGYYNGTTFHRVIPNFVVQGGDPTATGFGGPGYCIPDEIEGNPHKHEIGMISMAHAGPNTGGSQFFLVRKPQPHLDGLHTVFGKIIDGLQVIYDLQQGDELIEVTPIEISTKIREWELQKINC